MLGISGHCTLQPLAQQLQNRFLDAMRKTSMPQSCKGLAGLMQVDKDRKAEILAPEAPCSSPSILHFSGWREGGPCHDISRTIRVKSRKFGEHVGTHLENDQVV